MTDEGHKHPRITELLPWYLNGTIGELDRQRVDAHLQGCLACREELEIERRIHAAMSAESSVQYMPAASLKRLQAAIGELKSGNAREERPAELARRMPWKGLAAASIALLALGVAFSTADRWAAARKPPAYHTVTTTMQRPADEVIRAVFSPTITLGDLQAILDEAQLRIVSGPTEAGVFSLAATSHRPVSSSLALLRRHPSVRFAESTQLTVQADASRSSAPSPSGEPP